jgi:hypothetical protein
MRQSRDTKGNIMTAIQWCRGTGVRLSKPECTCPECTEQMIVRHAVGLIDIGISPTRDDITPLPRQRRKLSFDELRVMRSR